MERLACGLQVLKHLGKWSFCSSGFWHRGRVQIKIYKDMNEPTSHMVYARDSDNVSRTITFPMHFSRALASFNRIDEDYMIEVLEDIYQIVKSVGFINVD